MNKRGKIPELSLDIINRAVTGEEEALITLLERYDAEITHWALFETRGVTGCLIVGLDEDTKSDLQVGYMEAVMNNWRELI